SSALTAEVSTSTPLIRHFGQTRPARVSGGGWQQHSSFIASSIHSGAHSRVKRDLRGLPPPVKPRILCCMWRVGMFLAMLTASGLGGQSQPPERDMRALTLLADKDCANSHTMQVNLDGALAKLGWPRTYEQIDVATLAKDDIRTGYATPTVLWRDRDLF